MQLDPHSGQLHLPEMVPSRVHATDTLPAELRPTLERLVPALSRMDPLADEVIKDFAKLAPGKGFKQLEQALSKGVHAVADAPDSLRALFHAVDHVPPWVDWSRLERAGRTFFRSTAAGGIVLGAKSLALGYCAPAGNKPLVLTGRLQGDMSRRLAETGRFAQATCAPNGLRRDQSGFSITIKVRVMHAQVRRLLLESGQWDDAAWGAPINQHDMLATMLLFSLVFIDGIRQFGVPVSDEALTDYLHLWRYAGYLMGVEEGLLPTDEASARRSETFIVQTQGAPDDDSRALIRALVETPLAQAKTPLQSLAAQHQVYLTHGFLRELLGGDMADALGLSRTAYRHAIPTVRWLVRLGGFLARPIPGARAWAEASGKRYWEAAIEDGAGKTAPRYAYPLKLAAGATASSS